MRGQEIIERIRSSVSDAAFYRRVRAESLWPAVKVFGVLGIVGIGISMVFALTFVIVPFAFSNSLDKLATLYPNDLVITGANGAVTINQPEPYYVKNTLFDGGPKNLVIFDGGDTLPADLQKADTAVLVKRTYMISGSKPSDQRLAPFTQIAATTTIQKSDVVGVIEKVRPYFMPAVLGGGILFVVLATIAGAFFWVIFHCLYILAPAVVIFALSYLGNDRLKYREAYMVTLCASIPVTILVYLLGQLSVPLPPYAYTLFVLVVAIINNARQPAAILPAVEK